MYVPCFQSPHSEPVNVFKAKGRFALHLSVSQLTAFFIFSLICSLWSPTGVALAQDNNHISVWSSLSSPAKRWNSQVGLRALEYYFVLHSTFIHVVWLMLAISPDETVPQQDMIDGSHIPNPYPPSDPARNLFLPTTKKFGCPYRCWENLFFPEISFCTRSIFNPFRCLIHMQSKWSFQPVKWEALCLLKFLIWISCFVLELSIWTVLPWLSFLTHLSDVWPHSLTPLSLIRVEQSLSCDKWNGENCSLKIYSV